MQLISKMLIVFIPVLFLASCASDADYRAMGRALSGFGGGVNYSPTHPSAHLKGQHVDGLHRFCVYNHVGGDYIITIPSSQLCPLISTPNF